VPGPRDRLISLALALIAIAQGVLLAWHCRG
jgi:hypothetical protein